MMKFRMTMEAALRVVKFTIAPFACWPLPADAKPSDFWRLNLRWWIILVHMESSGVLIVWNIYMKRNNFNAAMVNAIELTVVLSNTAKMVICKVQATRLQVIKTYNQGLLAELHMFLKRATKEEMETIQFYVDKCYVFHLLFYICAFLGPFFSMVGPTVSQQPLPADDKYPFSTESFWVWLIAYVSQCIILLQVSAMVIVSCMYAVLLWFVVARFEMNCREFRHVTTADDLRRCISKHQQLLEYTDQVRLVTRPMALHVTSLTLISASTGGFMLTCKLPILDSAKYCLYYFGSVLQLFTFAWPADTLMDMSVKIGDSAYNSAWVGKTVMLKDIILIVRKTQFPIEIAYDGLLPAVSLSLCRVCISATFSYLATLRAMADD